MYSYDRRTAAKVVLSAMSQDQLLKIFDSLRPKQRIRVTMKAVMGHSPSETGTPTEYIVGRRSYSKRHGVHSISLLRIGPDGKPQKPHPMNKVTLMKRKSYNDGEEYVSVAIGDMGATLISIQT